MHFFGILNFQSGNNLTFNILFGADLKMTWRHRWPVSSWCSYICWTGFSCAPLLGHHLPWGGTNERRSKSISFLCTYYWQYIFHLSLSHFPFLVLSSLCSSSSLQAFSHVCFFPSRWPDVCIDCRSRRKAAKVPSFRRVLSDRTGGSAGNGELQGPCIRGERESLRGNTHNVGWGGGSGPVGVDMKLKQRMVVLCAVLLLLGLAKIFLLDGGEGSAASRRDLRAFRKVRVLVSCCHLQLCLKNIYIYISKQCANIYILI